MRIAYIVKRYPRYSETFIVNEILAHERAGLEVVIIALLPPQDAHFQDIISQVKAPVIYLSPRADKAKQFWEMQKQVSKKYPNFWQALSRFDHASAREALQAMELIMLSQEHDIRHYHAHFATTSTTVAQLASCVTDIPFTFTAHAKDIFHQDNDFDALKNKFSDCKQAVTVSQFNIEYLTKELGVSERNLTKIYNGLDLRAFPYSSPIKREPIICAVGRLVEKKGFRYLIEACDILNRQGIEFRCEIIGSGELKQSLKQKIIELELEHCVVVIGALPQAQVKQRISQACVFAAPCLVGKDGNRDGLPTVLLESMALGTPCISTRVTGIPEVIIDGVTGRLLEPENSEELAIALVSLLEDSALRESFARQAVI